MGIGRRWRVAAVCVIAYGVLTFAFGLLELVTGDTEQRFSGVLFVLIGGLAVGWGVTVLHARAVARRKDADDRDRT